MVRTVRRVALGLLVIAVIGAVPIIALGSRLDAAAGAKPSQAGPKKTPRPSPTPTRPPTPAPTQAPTRLPPTVVRRPLPPTAPRRPRRRQPPTAPPTAQPSAPLPAVLVGAGDIASAPRRATRPPPPSSTSVGGTVFTLGDNVYENGTATEFANCYGPSWGRLHQEPHAAGRRQPRIRHGRTRRATSATSAPRPAIPTKGYYAYDRGAWRVYVLNSNCASIGGCGAGSAQEPLAARRPRRTTRGPASSPCGTTRCYSSGEHGNSAATQAL